MTEQWKVIEDFPTYEISNHGRIRNRKTGRILKTNINDKGYEIVCIRKDNRQYTKKIHKLVADAFCEKYYDDTEVTHMDFNRLNNRSDNLDWRRRSDILRRAFRKHGRRASNPTVKVLDMSTGILYDSITECSYCTGCSISAISRSINQSCIYSRGYRRFKAIE